MVSLPHIRQHRIGPRAHTTKPLQPRFAALHEHYTNLIEDFMRTPRSLRSLSCLAVRNAVGQGICSSDTLQALQLPTCFHPSLKLEELDDLEIL